MASEYGSRLVPQVVDRLAEDEPQRVFASIPLDPLFETGTRDVTFVEFARAVNRCAWWIQDRFGKSETFEAISYLGTYDLSIMILILASIKTGYKLLLCSPADSIEAYLILHEKLNCKIILTSEEVPSKATELLSNREGMRHVRIPGLQDWLRQTSDDVKTYPYTKSFAEARQEPFVVLTTSGSTGTGKLIVMTHGTMSHHDLFCSLPLLEGAGRTTHSYLVGKRVFAGLALYHSAGICFMLIALFAGFTVVMPPPGPPTAAAANGAHVNANVQGTFVAPFILTEISRSPEYLENLKKLEYVTFGGASLPREVGDILSKHVRLFVSFGSTETGYYALEMTEAEDWEYVKPSALMGCDFQELGSGIYELHFKREKSLERHQGVFSTFPNKQDFTLNDIYSKHPTKEGLWLFEGRSDDLIGLSSGAKINPLPSEAYIGSHAAVAGILLTGSGRLATALLIEPKMSVRSEQDERKLLNELWPRIEHANAQILREGKIDRRLVLFTSVEKPMLRAGKGTVRRKVTLNLYADEINELYTRWSQR